MAETSQPVRNITSERLLSLDAYRGFVMLAMASGGLGLGTLAELRGDSLLWHQLEYHTSHAEWVGCSFWDLIQPSFMFIVGAAMPFSYAQRRARGDSWIRLFGHALVRSVVLVILGVFLASAWSNQTNYRFTNVLAQIGLGYMFVFVLLNRGPTIQIGAVLAILVGYWLWFVLYPLPVKDFPFATYGVITPRFQPGLLAHFEKGGNAAAAFDRWFLDLFPHPANKSAAFNPEGYVTLNFIPSIATMLCGVLAGEWLRSSRSAGMKFKGLLVVGAGCILLGTLMDTTVCPVVKRIWTPSWVVYSTGWTCWMMAAFYAVFDLFGWKWLAWPFVVVGANSIAVYMMSQLMKPWIAKQLKIHLGSAIFAGEYGPLIQSASTLAVLWLIAAWMYRRKIFIRI